MLEKAVSSTNEAEHTQLNKSVKHYSLTSWLPKTTELKTMSASHLSFTTAY